MASCFACGKRQPDPQTVYDKVWTTVNLGDYTSALQQTDQALLRHSNAGSEWHWRFLALKSEILLRQGFYAECLAHLSQEPLANVSNTDIPVWRDLTKGAALAYLLRFQEADTVLNSAYTLAKQVQPQLVGEALLRKGTLASLQDNSEDARNLFHSALDFSRERKDSFLEIASLGSLGLVATRSEHYDESVDWNKQALQLARSVGANSSVAKIEGNIAWSYYEVGDLDGALELFRQAEQDEIAAGSPERRVTWLLNTGIIQYDLHNYAEAESVTRNALALARSLKDPESIIEALHNLTLIDLQKNNLADAQQSLDEAVSLEGNSSNEPRTRYSQLISAQVARKMKNDALAEKLLSQITADRKTPTSLRWEAHAALAKLHASQAKNAIAEKEFQQSIFTITRARSELEHEDFRLSFLSSSIGLYDDYINFLISQKRNLDALKIADISRAQTLERGLSPSSKSPGITEFRPQELARRLNATLLFYWLGQDRSWLWAITPAKVTLLELPPGGEIDAAVKNYRDAFFDVRDPLESANADGKNLYAKLVQPAQNLISKDSRVVILPDGSLNGLNFETLLVDKPQLHYWIEDATITTANSLSLLSRAVRSSPPKSGKVLLVGDPLPASPEFPSLPLPDREINIVKKYFPDARRTVLTRFDATPSRVLASNPAQYDYLHFATHGTASRLRPLESAVILSPEGDSFKLYARDIVQHPIRPYLVTISACNGAGSRTYAGEGLVGLSWAFLRAGAHNVIAGLWEVSNASTPQMMDELYKGLDAGQDPATALRKAKLTLVHSTGNYRKPFYWAPFLLYSGS